MKTRCMRELVWVFLLTAVPPAKTSVKLAQTGQTICYDASNNPTPCTGTGQDGDKLAGVAWPDPRFTPISASTGTVVTDNLTGLMWAGDPTLSTLCSAGTTTTWQEALDYVACLNTHYYLSYRDWRLPNRKELRSLANYGQANSADWLNTEGAGNPGFSNVQAGNYWSSTTYAGDTGRAWYVYMIDGFVYSDFKSNPNYYVWPVRSGQ